MNKLLRRLLMPLVLLAYWRNRDVVSEIHLPKSLKCLDSRWGINGPSKHVIKALFNSEDDMRLSTLLNALELMYGEETNPVPAKVVYWVRLKWAWRKAQ